MHRSTTSKTKRKSTSERCSTHRAMIVSFPKECRWDGRRSCGPGKTFKEIYVVPSGFQNGLEEVLDRRSGRASGDSGIRSETAASDDIYLMNAPAAAETRRVLRKASLSTDADRLREKYKEVGDAQGHDFGEGGPGSRPPNFNLTVQPPKPAAPAPKASATVTTGARAKPPRLRRRNPVRLRQVLTVSRHKSAEAGRHISDVTRDRRDIPGSAATSEARCSTKPKPYARSRRSADCLQRSRGLPELVLLRPRPELQPHGALRHKSKPRASSYDHDRA